MRWCFRCSNGCRLTSSSCSCVILSSVSSRRTATSSPRRPTITRSASAARLSAQCVASTPAANSRWSEVTTWNSARWCSTCWILHQTHATPTSCCLIITGVSSTGYATRATSTTTSSDTTRLCMTTHRRSSKRSGSRTASASPARTRTTAGRRRRPTYLRSFCLSLVAASSAESRNCMHLTWSSSATTRTFCNNCDSV